jgi:hypothetical protein
MRQVPPAVLVAFRGAAAAAGDMAAVLEGFMVLSGVV